MPRHPPNALISLDCSHCQCPSLMVPIVHPLAKLSNQLKQKAIKTLRFKPEDQNRTSTGQKVIRLSDAAYQQNARSPTTILKARTSITTPKYSKSKTSKKGSALFKNAINVSTSLYTGNTPVLPKAMSFRPASRDMSNDARSGNANRHDVQQPSPKARQPTTIIRHDYRCKGCNPGKLR